MRRSEIRIKKLGLAGLVGAILLGALVLSPAHAEKVTLTVKNRTNSLSVASGGNVVLDVSPSNGVTIGKDTIKVQANGISGYRMLIGPKAVSSEMDFDLKRSASPSGKTIKSVQMGVSNPKILGNNQWGFAVKKGTEGTEDYPNFSNDYSLSSPSSETKWGGFLGSGALELWKINNASGGNIDKSLDVYYGVKADASLPSGLYKGTVEYTVIAQAVGGEEEETAVTPEEIVGNAGEEVMMTTNMRIAPEESGILKLSAYYDKETNEFSGDCEAQKNSDGTLRAKCKIPQLKGKVSDSKNIPVTLLLPRAHGKNGFVKYKTVNKLRLKD